MSRFQMCPASIAMGNQVCPEWQGEDAARLLRFLLTPVKIVLVALLLGIALALSIQWAQPFSFGPGANGTGHYAVTTARTGAGDQQVREQVEAFLIQFEVREAQPASGGGGSVQPHPVP